LTEKGFEKRTRGPRKKVSRYCLTATRGYVLDPNSLREVKLIVSRKASTSRERSAVVPEKGKLFGEKNGRKREDYSNRILGGEGKNAEASMKFVLKKGGGSTSAPETIVVRSKRFKGRN